MSFRDPSRTLPRFRDRAKIFRDPRYSRNHSIPPLLSQLLRLLFEGMQKSKRNQPLTVKSAFIQGFPINSYFKRLPKETENKSLKVIRNVFTRDNSSTQCYATTCSLLLPRRRLHVRKFALPCSEAAETTIDFHTKTLSLSAWQTSIYNLFFIKEL